MDKIIFTKIGFEELKKKTEDLIKERPVAVLDLKKAREMGDLSENGYYKAAKFKLIDIDRAIRKNNYLIKHANVITPVKNDKVGIGSKITVETEGKEKKYEIVGKYEANPSESKISYLSPVGKALLGKKAGESVRIKLQDKIVVYKIVNIN